jgi:hypothetical protein
MRCLADALSEPALAAHLLAEAAAFKADLDTARDASLVRNTPFFGAVVILETIFLPRQARDKHGKS